MSALNVVSLCQHKQEDLKAVARALLDMVESGEVTGLAWVAKFGPLDHRAGTVGDYKRAPMEAHAVTVKMQRVLEREALG